MEGNHMITLTLAILPYALGAVVSLVVLVIVEM